MDSSSIHAWPRKAWSIEEELLKKKSKSVEDKYVKLLSEYHDLRIDNSKTVSHLRELERFKDISEEIVHNAKTTRKLEEKERLSLSSSIHQYRDKLEEAVEQICYLEKENKRLKGEVVTFKSKANISTMLAKDVEEAKQRANISDGRVSTLKIENLELKNKKTALMSSLQEAKARTRLAEEVADEKREECKRLTAKLASAETAWESSRNQNLRLQKELKAASNSAELARELCEQSRSEVHLLEKDQDSLNHKLKQRDHTLDDLKEDTSMLKRELAKLKDENRVLEKSNTDLRIDNARLMKREDDYQDELRSSRTEVKVLQNMNDTSSRRVEDLATEASRLQHQLLDIHGDYVKKVNSEEMWKLEEKNKLRRQVNAEIEGLKKPRKCKNCLEGFTLEANTAHSCVYHPGRYLPRPYPLEGYSWSCCMKRDISSRPCKFAGRHVARDKL